MHVCVRARVSNVYEQGGACMCLGVHVFTSAFTSVFTSAFTLIGLLVFCLGLHYDIAHCTDRRNRWKGQLNP